MCASFCGVLFTSYYHHLPRWTFGVVSRILLTIAGTLNHQTISSTFLHTHLYILLYEQVNNTAKRPLSNTPLYIWHSRQDTSTTTSLPSSTVPPPLYIQHLEEDNTDHNEHSEIMLVSIFHCSEIMHVSINKIRHVSIFHHCKTMHISISKIIHIYSISLLSEKMHVSIFHHNKIMYVSTSKIIYTSIFHHNEIMYVSIFYL